jgi:hypothetical protein
MPSVVALTELKGHDNETGFSISWFKSVRQRLMASVKAFAILASNYRDVSNRKSTPCIGESRESGRLP